MLSGQQPEILDSHDVRGRNVRTTEQGSTIVRDVRMHAYKYTQMVCQIVAQHQENPKHYYLAS